MADRVGQRETVCLGLADGLMLAVVSMSLEEADNATEFARHHFAQGADRIIVKDALSTDGTADLLRAEGVEVLPDYYGHCRQAATMSSLAHYALDQGASWVIPADMDERWLSCTGEPVSEALRAVPAAVSILDVEVFQQPDPDRRFSEAQHLVKVCFRAHPNAKITMGNHDVYGVPGDRMGGVLEIREFPYRSAAHFRAKVRQRLATLDPSLSVHDAAHYRRLEGMSDEELDKEYEAWRDRPVVAV